MKLKKKELPREIKKIFCEFLNLKTDKLCFRFNLCGTISLLALFFRWQISLKRSFSPPFKQIQLATLLWDWDQHVNADTRAISITPLRKQNKISTFFYWKMNFEILRWLLFQIQNWRYLCKTFLIANNWNIWLGEENSWIYRIAILLIDKVKTHTHKI